MTTIGDTLKAKLGQNAVSELKRHINPRGRELGTKVSSLLARLNRLAKSGDAPALGWIALLDEVEVIAPSLNGSAQKMTTALSKALANGVFNHASRGQLPDASLILDRIQKIDLGPEFKFAHDRARDLAFRLRQPAPAKKLKSTTPPTPIAVSIPEDLGVLNPDNLTAIPELAKAVFGIDHEVNLKVLMPNGQTVERQIFDYKGKTQLRLRLTGLNAEDNECFVVWIVDATSNRVCNILCGIGNLGINPKTVEGLTVHFLRFLLDAYTKANSKKPKVAEPLDGGTISFANASKFSNEKLWQLGFECSHQLAKHGDSREIGEVDGHSASLVRWDSDKRQTFTIRVRDKASKGGAIIAWNKGDEPQLVSCNGKFDGNELASMMSAGDGTILRRAVAMAISAPKAKAA